MGNYLKWIMDGFDAGLSAEENLADAAERYAKEWGVDKITKVSGGMIGVDFIGNVEGRHLLDSKADILVCDGFVGNTILKFAESWVNLFIRQLNKQIMYKKYYQMTAMILEPVFSNLKKIYDYEEFGGVPLLGVNGVIIVSHGTSTSKAVKNSLTAAQKCVSENLLGDIQHGIKEHMVGTN